MKSDWCAGAFTSSNTRQCPSPSADVDDSTQGPPLKKMKLEIQLLNIESIKDITMPRSRYRDLIKMMHNLCMEKRTPDYIDSVTLFNHLQEKRHCSKNEFEVFLEKMEEEGIIMTSLNDIFIL